MPPHFWVMIYPHGSPTTELWVNVWCHVLPNNSRHGETVAILWDRLLSLGDEHLVSTDLWSVLVFSWHMSVQDVLSGLCSCHSAEEIRFRVRDKNMAKLVLFITQQCAYFLFLENQMGREIMIYFVGTRSHQIA